MKRVAIVTAASQGMGLACAKELSNRGYDLAIMSRTDEIHKIGKSISALSVTGSVTSQSDLENLVNLTLDKYGRIDCVVNNTGHPAKGGLLELVKEDWHNGLDLIITSVSEMAKLVVPIMKKNNGGSIVNISTFAAFEPNKSFPISSSLRAALAGYTKLFSDEFANDNIRMNNVLPGYINSYEITDGVKETIPMRRSGTVEEIAKTVVFLLSNDSSYITGQNIKVDGGITRGL